MTPWADTATSIAAAAAIVAAIATAAAIVAAVCAFLSYRLSKRIYDEIKSDEVIVSGPLHHPGLLEKDHDNCVLRCTLFNKSRRRAYVNSVETFGINRQRIPIKWSNRIDKLGNVIEPTGFFGLADSVNLVMRREDGKAFGNTTVIVKHSFSSKTLELVYDPYSQCGDDDG